MDNGQWSKSKQVTNRLGRGMGVRPCPSPQRPSMPADSLVSFRGRACQPRVSRQSLVHRPASSRAHPDPAESGLFPLHADPSGTVFCANPSVPRHLSCQAMSRRRNISTKQSQRLAVSSGCPCPNPPSIHPSLRPRTAGGIVIRRERPCIPSASRSSSEKPAGGELTGPASLQCGAAISWMAHPNGWLQPQVGVQRSKGATASDS